MLYLHTISRICTFLLTACIILASEVYAQDGGNAAEDLSAYPPSQEWVPALADKQEKDPAQLFVVSGTGGANAVVSMHQKDKTGVWKELFSCDAYVGSLGIGQTTEGVPTTPAGVFHFTEAFGINDDPGCVAFPYHKLTWNDYWSGDQREGYAYNRMVDIANYPGLDTWNSEHLIECAGFYEYCLNISYNEACVPGLGSAIFLHCMNPSMPYTEGCVAIPQDKMIFTLQHVQKDCVVVIGEQGALQNT